MCMYIYDESGTSVVTVLYHKEMLSEIFTKFSFKSMLKSVLCIHNKTESNSMSFPNKCLKLDLKMYFCFKSMLLEVFNCSYSTSK